MLRMTNKAVAVVVLLAVAGNLLVPCSLRAQASIALPRFSALPVPMQMHSTVVVGKRVYVLGGDITTSTQQVWTNRAFSAEILESGRLGAWREERSLPEYRCYAGNSTEVINNRIYLVAGQIARDWSTPESEAVAAHDAIYTTVQSDGSLGAWKRTSQFTTAGRPTNCASTSSSDRFVLLVGGMAAGQVSDQILVSTVAADGDLVQWRKAGSLPKPLWFHGSTIAEDRMYVWGGLSARNSGQPSPSVFSAPVNADGSVGAWRTEAPMPNPVYAAAYCGFNDYLVTIGGRHNKGYPTNTIHYARIVNGTVTGWNPVATNLQATVYHSLGLDRSRGIVFITGGQNRITPTAEDVPSILSAVQTFRLAQPENARLDTTVTQTAAQAIPFTNLDDAFRKAESSGKDVLAFFYSPEVPACRRCWDSIISIPAFARLADPFVFAIVNTSHEDVSHCYTYGIFKVPALMLASKDRHVIRKEIRLSSMEDVRRLVAADTKQP